MTLVRREPAQKLAEAEPSIFGSDSQGSGKGDQFAARALKSSLSLKDLQRGDPSHASRLSCVCKSPETWKKVSTGGDLHAPEWI